QVKARLAAARSAALAEHAIASLAELKLELDLHLGLAGMDQLVGAAGPALAPQRPGDRVQERRLTVAVVAGEAGDVDSLELQRLMDVGVAHEVSQLETQRNHRWSSSSTPTVSPRSKRSAYSSSTSRRVGATFVTSKYCRRASSGESG